MHARGFTLLELMITAVILAILAGVAFPAYSQYVKRARQAEATAALGDIRSAQLMYKQDPRMGNGQYAPNIAALGWTVPTTGTNVGKGPAFYTYYTHQAKSCAVTPHTSLVNNSRYGIPHATGVLSAGDSCP